MFLVLAMKTPLCLLGTFTLLQLWAGANNLVELRSPNSTARMHALMAWQFTSWLGKEGTGPTRSACHRLGREQQPRCPACTLTVLLGDEGRGVVRAAGRRPSTSASGPLLALLNTGLRRETEPTNRPPQWSAGCSSASALATSCRRMPG